MSSSVTIVDNTGKRSEFVKENGDTLLKVATTSLRKYDNAIRFFTDINGNPEIAQNFAFSGTPEQAHNGTDNAYWTGTTIIGSSFTFDSTGQNHTPAGTKSIYVNKPSVGDIFQIDKGSSIDLDNYVALTLWVYITGFWDGGDNIELYGWDTGGGTQVGSRVQIQNYINTNNLNVWQQAIIPEADLRSAGANIIDAFRVEIAAKTGSTPVFYLDDIQLEETGNIGVYKLAPLEKEILQIKKINIFFVESYNPDRADATANNLSYDKILSQALSPGFNYQVLVNGVVAFSLAVKTIYDLLQIGFTKTDFYFDGTNTVLKMTLELVVEDEIRATSLESYQVTVAEDLTHFISFRINAEARIRT